MNRNAGRPYSSCCCCCFWGLVFAGQLGFLSFEFKWRPRVARRPERALEKGPRARDESQTGAPVRLRPDGANFKVMTIKLYQLVSLAPFGTNSA
jgi:hypothetical protein